MFHFKNVNFTFLMTWLMAKVSEHHLHREMCSNVPAKSPPPPPPPPRLVRNRQRCGFICALWKRSNPQTLTEHNDVQERTFVSLKTQTLVLPVVSQKHIVTNLRCGWFSFCLEHTCGSPQVLLLSHSDSSISRLISLDAWIISCYFKAI